MMQIYQIRHNQNSQQVTLYFQDGESWHISASNKWGNANFDIDYVPFPVGPNVLSDMSNYRSLTVGGKSTYAISSQFSKANIPAGL